MRFDNNPCYAVFDENVLENGPLSAGGYFSQLYTWSSDNRAELDKGWIKKADDAQMLAEQLDLDPDVLGETLEGFFDADGPLYAMEVTMGTWHTAGGLGTDMKARALDWYGNPVPGLYAAGECGCAPGLVYQPGMYHAEAITTGLAAGRTIVEEG